MENVIEILEARAGKNRIDYDYIVKGEWKKIFENKEKLFIEYSQDISHVPESVAFVPLLCNLLPIAWLYDATIKVKCCDKDFFDSIPEFEKGYINMYPDLEFKGNIEVEKIEKNKINGQKGAMTFFSGGVDAYTTLINHLEEKPTLITLWGADIKVNDNVAWKNVLNQITQVADEYNLDYIIIKTNLRDFIDTKILGREIANKVNESWWHGFQHGIGVISHAAPIAYIMKKSVVYFASSFTPDEHITCASHYTIDNYLKFCGVKIIHDGVELSRQDKVHRIVEFCKESNRKIKLRVCWQETNKDNCCECEKCCRTIIELFSEGVDPKDYGFNYNEKQLKKCRKIYYDERNVPEFSKNWYKIAQERMRKNLEYKDVPKELRWFYKIDIKKLGYHPIYKNIKKLKVKVKKILKG